MTQLNLNFNVKFLKNKKTAKSIFLNIYGLSQKNVENILLLNFGYLRNKKIHKKDFDKNFLTKLEKILSKYKKVNLEENLKKQINYHNNEFLKKMQNYKELRKKHNLPCRGQRTKTNAQTCKKKNKSKITKKYKKKKK